MIVFDLERFTRQPKDGERMIDLAAAGLLVLDSESEYDLTTPNGKKSFRDAIKAVPGVKADTAKSKVGTAEVTGDFDAAALVEALNKAGFHVKVKK